MSKKKKKYEERLRSQLEGPDIESLDLLKLELHWLGHDELVRDWGELQAEAELDLEETQSALDLKKADVEFKLRKSDPEHHGFEKWTEGAIKCLLIKNEKVQDYEKRVRIRKHKVRLLKGVMKRLDNRKRALEKLVDLHGQQYFAVPRSPASDSDFETDARKKRSRKPVPKDSLTKKSRRSQ